jgi:uncharacterized protein (TIGR03663 family)
LSFARKIQPKKALHMDSLPTEARHESWLEKPLASFIPKIKIEHGIMALILILAIISRFSNLGARVMSHDEVNHVIPSYDLYQGRGYIHSPVTHGPLQFHLIAASYFLFGDSDFTSRIPTATFGVLSIAFVMIAFKRYLGRSGSLIAGFLFLISPYMLFYTRYARNETFVSLFGLMMIWSVLYYLEKGKTSTLYIYVIATVLHVITKETSYIYNALILIFLAILFMRDVLQLNWSSPKRRQGFLITLLAGLGAVGVALVAALFKARGESSGASTAGGLSAFAANNQAVFQYGLLISVAIAVILIVIALVTLFRDQGWARVKTIRSFDLLFLTGTLILPLLTALPVSLLGFDPLDYSQTGLIHTSIVLVVLALVSIAGGIAWRPRVWITSAVIFYAIFTVFYTTFFTNGNGFFTGMVGSLGYWLSQQSVQRGEQPLYYYLLIQIPMYEYLPAIGTIAAAVIAARKKLFSQVGGLAPAQHVEPANPVEPQQTPVQLPLTLESGEAVVEPEKPVRLPVMALLLFWSLGTLGAFSVAGEKMPWLTVHITLPMILAAAWGLGYLVDRIAWRELLNRKGLLALLLFPVFITGLGAVLQGLLGTNRPFQGIELAELQASSTFIFGLAATLLAGWGIGRLLKDWSSSKVISLFGLILAAVLALFTARSAYQASFINYDTAKEFLVYAHAASGPKEILKQVEEISKRTVGGKNVRVAYVGDALYPYWWYFRDYPNKTWFENADKLTKELLSYPLVIGDDQYDSQVKSILKDQYVEYNYKRLWWPMQDYFNLTPTRIWDALTNPQMRQALLNIWLNKDYTLYASIKNDPNLTLETWQPSAGLHFYIRKDVVSQIWNYGTVPAAAEPAVDPYAARVTTITPDRFFGAGGTGNGQFNGPRGIAAASDGSIYVVDSGNNRIQHFSADGKWLNSWGSFASVDQGSAPGGTFNQPFGIAVGPDGSVYVADTWNFRIQKFSAEGQFVTMWGVAGQAETPDAFWGPRGVAVDASGKVYVTDTGNKRVAVFDANGQFITQFGTYGMNAGQLDEPVGLAIASNGNVFVADTWNQRVQVFAPNPDGTFSPLREWTISGWSSQSLDNKPLIGLDAEGNLFAVSSDSFRVLEFDPTGAILRVWGDFSSGIDGFSIPADVISDGKDGVWVSDAGNNYVLHYTLPAVSQTSIGELPAFPTSSIVMTFNALTNNLENPLKQSVYHLDTLTKEWIPIVPQEIASVVQSIAAPEKDLNGMWVLKGTDGQVLFNWNADLLLWVGASPAGISAPASPTATQ